MPRSTGIACALSRNYSSRHLCPSLSLRDFSALVEMTKGARSTDIALSFRQRSVASHSANGRGFIPLIGSRPTAFRRTTLRERAGVHSRCPLAANSVPLYHVPRNCRVTFPLSSRGQRSFKARSTGIACAPSPQFAVRFLRARRRASSPPLGRNDKGGRGRL